MTRASTRKTAVEQAKAHDLEMEPNAIEPGLRDWFETLPQVAGIAAAAFDSRVDAAKLLTGQASHGIRARLRRLGCTVILPPESFLVDKQPRLITGEAARAVEWGRTLGQLTATRDSAGTL